MAFIWLLGGLMSFAKPKPPGRLDIWGEEWHVFEVKIVAHTEAYLGDTDCRLHAIFIKKGQRVSEKAKTLMHEILHAYTCVGGEVHNEKYNNSPGSNHDGIYFLEQVLTDFYFNNWNAVCYIRDAMGYEPPEEPPKFPVYH